MKIFRILICALIGLSALAACEDDVADPETIVINDTIVISDTIFLGGDTIVLYDTVFVPGDTIVVCDTVCWIPDTTHSDTTHSDTTGGGGNLDPVRVSGDTVFLWGEIPESTTWYEDTTYVMKEKVWVTNGATLTIEPGTLIKGEKGTGEDAVLLIITQGCRLLAQGTENKPIIFTSVEDDISRMPGGTWKNSTLDPRFQRGLWGGVVIIGKAPTNQATPRVIEGVRSDEPRGEWGGMVNEDPLDNSGILRYVSIRHGGTSVDPDTEINGLSLYAVGSGTTVEFIEVIGNDDDGIEFFGGHVNSRNLIVADCGDDSFDWDQGFDGNGQFWATFKNGGDVAGEHDGGKPDDAQPYATPVIFNATYQGDGAKETIIMRDGTGGEYHNSIFDNFAKGIYIEERDIASNNNDSKDRLDVGDLVFDNCIMSNTLTQTSYQVMKVDGDENHLGSLDAHPNIDVTVQDVTLNRFNPAVNLGITPSVPDDPWFSTTNYHGAFDPNGTKWTQGWTRFAELYQ